MAGARIVVLYPPPSDISKFDRDYLQDHAPMVTSQNFEGITKFVAFKIVGTPEGSPPPFHRIAELHFSSLASLQKAAGSSGAPQAVAHATAISSGGRPMFMIAEEETTSL